MVMRNSYTCPKNEKVNNISEDILNLISGESKIYKSIDFLSSLAISGLPPHILVLKIGAPIMILRNIIYQNYAMEPVYP